MRKRQINIIIIAIAAVVAGWFGYKYLFRKKTSQSTAASVSVQSFSSASCWLYHEYVFRVDFSDESLPHLFFVRNDDGSFSPSIADSSGNHVTGNGFIIDSAGSCITTQKMTAPWELTDEEKQPLKEIVEEWLDMKEDVLYRDFTITGQTVALFAILNDPQNYIEYNVTSDAGKLQSYGIIYPVDKVQLKGIQAGIGFADDTAIMSTSVFQVLKTTFDENSINNPLAVASIDSIHAEKSNDGYLDNINVYKGDDFFYEGSIVFDAAGRLIGNLHYEDKRWKLLAFQPFTNNLPIYDTNEPQEKWEYDQNRRRWIKTK